MLRRFFLLIVLFSFLAINVANAEISFNNSHPMPGETISFSGDMLISNNGYHRVLIKEPSGRYVLYPDYLTVHVKYNGHSSGSYKGYNINGTIKIGKDFVPGIYSLVFDFTSSLSDYIKQYKFTVGNYSLAWKYQTRYPGGGWNKENFDDSNWDIGYVPFGDSRFFNVNSSWSYSKLYLRKEVYLDDNIQAWLRLFYEGYGTCWVNGAQVFSSESINGASVGYCYRGGIKVYYHPERRSVFSVDRHYYSSKIYFVDISRHLHPGKNIIACEFTKRSRMYYTCWGTGCHYHRYYPSRNYVDVTFAPLQRDGVMWNGYLSQEKNYWYKPSFTPISVVELYDCETTNYAHGTTPRFARVNNFNYNSWKWSNLDITDDTTFYHKPEHFNWDKDYSDRRVYWGISPFNGHPTYFRKWIWSDKDKYAVLKLSATKKPNCYINGKQINIESYNNQYWTYYFDIKLNHGANLLACRENPSQFSIFDLTTSGFNGKLKVSNVSVENSDGGINLNVKLENLAHPEVQSLIEVNVDNTSYTKEVSSAQISNDDALQNLNILYSSDWFRNIISVNYKNVSYGNRASDGNWNTYAYLRNRNKMEIEKVYQLAPNLTLNDLKLKYKFVGETSIYFYNYKTNIFDYITTFKDEHATIRVVDVPNATNYVSSDGNVKFRVDVKKGQFSHCYSWGCYITYSNAYYYEDEIYAKGIQTVYANFTKINSYSNANLFVPLEPGSHDITVSAIDLIDGDIDIFSSNFSILIKPAGKVGFLPFGGNSGKSATTTSKNNTFVVVAASAIASASAAIAYLSKGKPASLKRLETSLSKAEKIVSRLQSYRSTSIRGNKFSFFRMLNEKYTAFKKHMRERKKEEARVEAIKEEIEEEKKRAKEEWLNEMNKELKKLFDSLYGTPEGKIRKIDNFLTKHDLPYKQAKYVLKYRRILFAQIFGVSSKDVKKLVKKFAKEIGLTNYVHLGRWADQLRLIIDDPRLRSKFEEFLEKQDLSENVSNDETNEESGSNSWNWQDMFPNPFQNISGYGQSIAQPDVNEEMSNIKDSVASLSEWVDSFDYSKISDVELGFASTIIGFFQTKLVSLKSMIDSTLNFSKEEIAYASAKLFHEIVMGNNSGIPGSAIWQKPYEFMIQLGIISPEKVDLLVEFGRVSFELTNIEKKIIYALDPSQQFIDIFDTIDMGAGWIPGWGDLVDLVNLGVHIIHGVWKKDSSEWAINSAILPLVFLGSIQFYRTTGKVSSRMLSKFGDELLEKLVKQGIPEDEASRIVKDLLESIKDVSKGTFLKFKRAASKLANFGVDVGKLDNIARESIAKLSVSNLDNLTKFIRQVPEGVDVNKVISKLVKNANEVMPLLSKLDFAALDKRFFNLVEKVDNVGDLFKYLSKADDVTEAANELTKLHSFGVSISKISKLLNLPIAEFSSVKSKALKEIDYLLSLRTDILNKLQFWKKINPEFSFNKIVFKDLEDGIIAQTLYGTLELDTSVDVNILLSRNTISHEISHMVIHQGLFGDASEYIKYVLKLNKMSKNFYNNFMDLQEFMADGFMAIEQGENVINNRWFGRFGTGDIFNAIEGKVLGERFNIPELTGTCDGILTDAISSNKLTLREMNEMAAKLNSILDKLAKNTLELQDIEHVIYSIGG